MARTKKAKLHAALRKAEAQKKQAAKAAPAVEKAPKKQPKLHFPYTKQDTLLLIGEGNFSFAHSIASKLGSGANIIATAYDSEQVAREKYPDLGQHIEEFNKLGGTVYFDVDGTKLHECVRLSGKRFSRIVFNFPHAGAGIKNQDRNIQTNKLLLFAFFTSAQTLLIEGTPKPPKSAGPKSTRTKGEESDSDVEAPMPKKKHTGARESVDTIEFEGVKAEVVYDAVDQYDPAPEDVVEPGQIHVTLKSGPPYDKWNIKHLARECGLVTMRTSNFVLDSFPGYEHRRTLGFKEGVSKDENKEIRDKNPKLYQFISKPKTDESDTISANGKRKKGSKKQALGITSESV
ncbi:hypothetical protein IWW40_005020 [Coemansia sp. RSA 1250]|nr:hypothetical protein IWW40_005020 [Coemansia sp. RSA 1250]